jgi:hypothetical protein
MKEENDFTSGFWAGYLVLALAILVIAFAIYSCIYCT